MAVQTANVYNCSVVLGSRRQVGHQRPEQVIVIAQSPDKVPGILSAQYGGDLIRYDGPVLALSGAITTMSGS